VLFGSIFLVWLIRCAKDDGRNIGKAVQARPYFFAAVAVFFATSLLGVAVSDMVLLSFGQWRAYFLEPLILFFILIGRRTEISVRQLVWPLSISTLSISIYAVVQKFTGFGIATPEWTAAATRRVTAFYTSPNAVALYLAPLVFLGVAFAIKLYKENKQQAAGVVAVIVFVSLAAIAFTFSQGAWIALAIGFVVFIGLAGYKKSAVTLGILGAVLACLILFFPNSLPVHYKSAGNRVLLWGYSQEFLTASPKNFILGAGVRQFFRKIQKPHYDVKVLERLIYPHNIFLNFWTEIGFFGMLSFIFIFVYISRISYCVYRHADRVLGAGLIVMLVVFFIHGLIDVPYFKNDLAMLWWVMAALILSASNKSSSHLTSFS
jgi:O-antigen ligase